jgi:membrane-associated phospholipid phosphatase
MDQALLHAINRPGVAWLDFLMVAFSNRLLLISIAVVGAVFVGTRTKRGWVGAVLLLAAAGAADLAGARVAKPLTGRLRPCRADPHIVAIAGCGSGSSLPSNHAATVAAGAVVLGWASPIAGVAFGVPLALVVGASRVYLGVHYPSDILAGYALGALIAIALIAIAKTAAPRLPAGRRPP